MNGGNINVLVVDDEDMVSRILKGYLELYGIAVTTVGRGDEALALMAETDFKAAIVDMRLPDMTGDDLIGRAITAGSTTRFFIYTGSLDYNLSDRLRSLGMEEGDILHKPVMDMGIIYRAIMKKLQDENH